MKRWSVMLGFLLLGTLANAARSVDATKPPWAWSVEERINRRTNPVLATERVRAAMRAEEHVPRVTSNSAASTEVLDVIDGNINPELFLPTEIFERLLTLSFVVEDSWRPSWERAARDAGLPVDFWNRLETISAPYVTELRWRYDLLQRAKANPAQRSQFEAQILGLSPAICRDSLPALAKARSVFGPNFDRFMYTTIARGMSKTVFGTRESRDQLLTKAKGCAE